MITHRTTPPEGYWRLEMNEVDGDGYFDGKLTRCSTTSRAHFPCSAVVCDVLSLPPRARAGSTPANIFEAAGVEPLLRGVNPQGCQCPVRPLPRLDGPSDQVSKGPLRVEALAG
jgi:hypothetical protein